MEFLALFLWFSQGQALGQQSLPNNLTHIPNGVILVKGAWSSASDSVTPLPEQGNVLEGVYRNRYFGLTYAVPPDWTEEYKGPPPSDTGRYVLAELNPASTFKGPARGSILITAEDLFFTPFPIGSAAERITYMKDHLQADYKVEIPPRQTRIADRPFIFLEYWSPAAELHWYVLATEIRCHVVEIVLSTRDSRLLESLVQDAKKLTLMEAPGSTGGESAIPVCIKDYARDENLITRVDPVLTEHRFDSIPVRIIIDKEGNVKHIHFLSAFPGQASVITEALHQWKFKPYRQNGQPLEVETGILFGRR